LSRNNNKRREDSLELYRRKVTRHNDAPSPIRSFKDFMRFPRKRFIIWIVVAIIATFGGTVLVLNLLPGEKQVEQRIPRLYSANEPAYQRSMGVLLGPAILQGNRVDTLLNGAQIFPAMLGEIEKARQTITFETYIYWEGAIGEQFAEKLAERSRAGVKIHVLLDWVGSQRMKPELLDRLKAAGVEIERYHPLSGTTSRA